MDKITFRPATTNDIDMIFEWRNAPETRKYFFIPRQLDKSEHIKWFTHSLSLQNRCILIAEMANQPIGVLRYDIDHSEAEIDIYLRPGISGKGFGTQILSTGTDWITKNHPEIKTLQAKVMAHNIASSRAFEKSGFIEHIKIYKKKIGED